MFFWKDMLARKKREVNASDEKILNKKITASSIKAKSIIPSLLVVKGGEVPIIRGKRSQADEWPIAYKGDAMKKTYRKKKKTDNSNSSNEDQHSKTIVLGIKRSKEKASNASRRSKIFEKLTSIQEDEVDNEIDPGKLPEEILHRTKRTEQ